MDDNLPIFLQKIKYIALEPYFFKNMNIDMNLYIFQPVDSIGKALFCIDVWNKEKYNIGNEEAIELKDISYMLYLYHSNIKIKKYRVRGKTDNPEDYRILQYKKNGLLYTAALLKMDK